MCRVYIGLIGLEFGSHLVFGDPCLVTLCLRGVSVCQTYEPLFKLLVSLFISLTPHIYPCRECGPQTLKHKAYIIPYIPPLLKSLDYGSRGLRDRRRA